MVYVDTNETDNPASAGEPGIYPILIRSCKEKHAKSSGEPMFSIEIENEQTHEKLCYANIMLGGKGFGMGKAALKALLGDFKGDLHASHLVGKRAWAALKLDEYQGKVRLQIDGRQGRAGYYPWDSQHEDVIKARELYEERDKEPF